MMASSKFVLLSVLVIGVVLGAALFAFNFETASSTELVQKMGAVKGAPKMHLVKREMLASAAQGRLAQKDRRIFASIALAAKHQETDGETEEKKFAEARQMQMHLDAQLESLTKKLHAQEIALAYMQPKVAKRDSEDHDLKSYVGQLKQEIPLIQSDLKTIHQRTIQAKESIKPLKDELKRTEEVLVKSRNAYQLFGQRANSAHDQAADSRHKVEELNFEALSSEKEETQLRKEAVGEHDRARAKFLTQEAKTDDAKVAMLNKQSAEMMQSAQLFDAEADEATAYQTMFAADLQSAISDERHQSDELMGAERAYQQGSYLETSGAAREAQLAGDLQGGAPGKASSHATSAESALASEDSTDKEDDAALARGEQATEETEKEIHGLEGQSVANTAAAEKTMTQLAEDRANWDRDAEQAYSLRVAAAEHRRAAEHLRLAAAAAAEVKKM